MLVAEVPAHAAGDVVGGKRRVVQQALEVPRQRQGVVGDAEGVHLYLGARVAGPSSARVIARGYSGALRCLARKHMRT